MKDRNRVAEAQHRVMCVGETMAMVTPATLAPLAEGQLFTVTAGGAESNVASHLAALGFDTIWLSRLGNGALGDRILSTLRDRGVDVQHVSRHRSRTGVYFKDPVPGVGPSVYYYRSSSAASRMSVKDLEKWPIEDATWVHLSGITLGLSASCSKLVERIVDDAPGGSYGVSFDVNYRPGLWGTRKIAAASLLEVGRRCEVLLVGLDEAHHLWNISTAEEVADLFHSVPTVVVKDAAVDAVEIRQTPDGTRTTCRVPALNVEVVEAVGAGDAFAAGFLAGYLRGDSPEARLAAGHRLAAWALGSLQDIGQRPMAESP